jgi:hypothetical protein
MMNLEDSFLQIRWILCVGIASWSIQCRNLACVPVFFGELLNSSTANLELIGNELRVYDMINNSLTYPDDIVLIEFHFTWSVVREIVLTKSLASLSRPGFVTSCFFRRNREFLTLG